MPKTGEYEIIHTRRLTPAVFELWLRAPEIADTAQPGQFLHIGCGESRLLRRPVSICDADGGAVRLVIGERGEGTKWLASRKAGDRLDVLGPLGHGFRIAGDGGPVLLAGGGLGVPPLVFAARRLGPRAHACAGFLCRDSVMLIDSLSGFCSGVSVCTDDGSAGVRGTVCLPLKSALETGRFESVLACGPRPMLRAVAALAREYGVPCQVSLEERMGCGVGACLVCACRIKSENGFEYKHVCSDGPVFDACEVDWDE